MRAPAATSVALLVLLTGCSAQAGSAGASPSGNDRPPSPRRLRVEVRETLPHDTSSFTQGLELKDDVLYEGTGLAGHSRLSAGPPGGKPSRSVSLPDALFGEGITLAGDRVWQLTWQNGVALERDAASLKERRRVPYKGEGWGLCHQSAPDRLVMSDGSSNLTFRDPRTFAVNGTIAVREGSRPVRNLNELECTPDGAVYANIWQTDRIIRIDPASGKVTASVDATGLLTPAERAAGADVLNGIASIPGTDEFWVTGKLWPKLFRVRFVPVG